MYKASAHHLRPVQSPKIWLAMIIPNSHPSNAASAIRNHPCSLFAHRIRERIAQRMQNIAQLRTPMPDVAKTAILYQFISAAQRFPDFGCQVIFFQDLTCTLVKFTNPNALAFYLSQLLTQLNCLRRGGRLFPAPPPSHFDAATSLISSRTLTAGRPTPRDMRS